jgi:hypothetical protein
MPDSLVPAWIQVLSALSAPVIGGAAIYIARQQWRTAELQRETNEKRWKHERYERRLKVYQEVREILSLVISSAHPDIKDLRAFRLATAEADFIYGDDVQKYIEEIFKKGFQLYTANQHYRDATMKPHPPGYDHDAVVDRMTKALEWFDGQFDHARELFRPYLDISD